MYNVEIESKHKAYHVFLQAIVILNTENFFNVMMGYRNIKVSKGSFNSINAI